MTETTLLQGLSENLGLQISDAAIGEEAVASIDFKDVSAEEKHIVITLVNQSKATVICNEIGYEIKCDENMSLEDLAIIQNIFEIVNEEQMPEF